MRNILLILLLICGFVACKDDDEIGFDVPVEFRKISFDAVPGGAVMRYKLPDNLDIFGVRVRYLNAYGRQLKKDGTYLSDTLLLNGFNEAQTDVPVQLTFLNSNLEESKSVEMTFNTRAAATVALFDDLTVNPFWGGFNVTYTAPETVEGTIHVFYIGTNPTTHQLDSILMGSFPIVEGGDTLNFEIKQALDELNVVVRTDDYEGNRVKLNVYENIPALAMETLAANDFDFSFMGEIQEAEKYGFGVKYLFDGKKKGDGFRKNFMSGVRRKYDTFMAGPEAFGKRFIFDLRTPRIPAALYAYAFLNFETSYPLVPTIVWPGDDVDMYISEVWSGSYPSRLPCIARVYGTNEDPRTVNLASCDILYTLNDSPYFANWRDYSWCRDSDDDYGKGKSYKSVSDAEFNAASPIILRMLCNYTGKTFRYLILVVEDTYLSNRWGNQYPLGYEENAKEFITFDEIEVLVKAE